MHWIASWIQRQEKPSAEARLRLIEAELDQMRIGSPEYEELINDYVGAVYDIMNAS